MLIGGTGWAQQSPQKKPVPVVPRGNSNVVFEAASHRTEGSVYTEGEVYRTNRDRKPGESPILGYAVCYFAPEDGETVGCMSEVVVLVAKNNSRDIVDADGIKAFRRRFTLDFWNMKRVSTVYLSAQCNGISKADDGSGDVEIPCLAPYLHFNRVTMQVKFSESADPDAPAMFMLGTRDGRVFVL
jgi:hypothetical protein